MNTDRIEKSIVLRAPRSAVWRALTTAEEFGTWFGAKLAGDFKPNSRVSGGIAIPKYDHLTIEMLVDRVEPERLLAFYWHPHAVDLTIDYSMEPMTLVEFHLSDHPDGIRLTVIESGFDRIPAARRAEAFGMNDAGWAEELKNIDRHVTGLEQ